MVSRTLHLIIDPKPPTYPIKLQSANIRNSQFSGAQIAFVAVLLQSSHCTFLIIRTLVYRRAATTIVVRAVQNAMVMMLYGWRVKASLRLGENSGGGFIAGDCGSGGVGLDILDVAYDSSTTNRSSFRPESRQVLIGLLIGWLNDCVALK